MTNDENAEINQFLNSEFIPTTVDLNIANEPNQPLPTSEAEDDFDRLLDEFITTQLQDADDTQEELIEAERTGRPLKESITDVSEFAGLLLQEERQLYDAFRNFIGAVKALADMANLDAPEFDFDAEDLYPRFRPSRGTKLNNNIFIGWDVILKAQPVRLKSLPPRATDEQILEFAEKTTDENLQMALISYVEILIELEGCEIAYNQRKAKAQKRRIERKIYEEHQARKEKIKRFINAIEEARLPIDADRLVNNYFKTSKKDPNGAKQILENNPATYAPIQIDKIPPRFFGMIKPKPEDGIRANKEIGRFLKNLKA